MGSQGLERADRGKGKEGKGRECKGEEKGGERRGKEGRGREVENKRRRGWGDRTGRQDGVRERRGGNRKQREVWVGWKRTEGKEGSQSWEIHLLKVIVLRSMRSVALQGINQFSNWSVESEVRRLKWFPFPFPFSFLFIYFFFLFWPGKLGVSLLYSEEKFLFILTEIQFPNSHKVSRSPNLLQTSAFKKWDNAIFSLTYFPKSDVEK